MKMVRGIPTRARSLAFAALWPLYVGALFWAEIRYPLRPRVEPGLRRLMRNAAMVASAGLAVWIAERPVVEPLARYCERRRIGLTGVLRARQHRAWGNLARDALAIVLLDYTLYLWHVLMHRWSVLYRLHQVHHADLDLDFSTAARFHFAEMLASVPWRAAQVLLIGTSPRALRTWQRATLMSILFHHANVRLPRRLERILGYFIATPRLHGIHHSVETAEQNSNWSNGLTIWDRLHGTFRASHAREEIEIGVPRYRSREEVTLGKLVRMPLASAAAARRFPSHSVRRE